MSDFTIRVELHNADSDDYEALHEKMNAKGYKKEITTDGKTYKLPTAEYVCSKDLSASEIRDDVLRIANSIKPKSDVLVTKSNGRAWSLSKA
ncbi:hypothetical protein CQP30_20260 [Yersinia pestis]|uniref:Phage protein n=4 Tax=Yersinia pestis TaxID=632 RepID=A0AAX2I5S6_YERPE|nr:hypothetical protein [Yersinia pestis]ERP73178.1 hypothetical protein L327_10465 [Yersinia pestis S3]ERP73770.1 hypothetical protein L328_10510 [Yersinia pestis 24H]ADV98796.1 hypothetical phage protein [Yersinia pestis biovar Medievalis str. Harbin 35]AEL73757.1 hypothetical protein A1122_15670 [Yersinia pestis A1122]AJI92398.1 hypothetical protein CH59_4029 [Yersinia pestis]